jgi:ATP-dependent helicase Lhr and Lhr-like helicase
MTAPRPHFESLHPQLVSLLKELDFAEATAAQAEAIPVILEGGHTLLIAPTGYGKTEAALLPVLDAFLTARDEYEAARKPLPAGIKILYVTPLRALNRDLLKRIERWGHHLGIEVGVRHGDTTTAERRRQALKPPDLLITTPETVQLLFTGSRLKAALETVRWFVVDEIHELAASERGWQLAVALERLEDVVAAARKTTTFEGFQRVGLSATVGNPETVARLLGGSGRRVRIVEVKVDKKIEITVEHPRPTKQDKVDAVRVSATPEQTAILARITRLVREHRATLVFSNTRDGSELLSSRSHLYDPVVPIGVHHGSLSKQARIEAEEGFKDGTLKALICTSSLELGIDVGETDLVIQNGSPRGVERLVQRVGRAGHHAKAISRGIILSTNGEDAAEAAVIARRAMARQLEPIRIRENPLGVLANQVVHLAVERGEVRFLDAHATLRRSAPFATLDRTLLERTLKQLEMQGLLSVDWQAESYTRRGSSRRYMIDNVSMITDEKTYRVVEAARRSTVGTLDEDFVLGYVEAGARFIMRGRTWDVLEVKADHILVAEGQALGALPSWQGEDLPVPYSVAQEVGRLRRVALTSSTMPAEYAMDADAASAFVQEVARNKDKALAVGTDDEWVLEAGDRVLVLNCCLGTRGNQTLGRLLEALVGQRLGANIQLTTDAYRIVLESTQPLRAQLVEEVLREIDLPSMESLLRLLVRNAPFLRYHLLNVARKFGAVAKDLDASKFSMRRLLDVYRGMPLFEEAVERVMWDLMDIPSTKAALEALTDGRVRLSHQKLSPMGRLGIEKERRGLSPAEEEPSILKALKHRLDDAKVLLVCVVCGHARPTTVERTPPRPECPSCSSIMIASVHPNEKEVAKLVKKTQRSENEEARLRRAVAGAHLVATYGKRAVMTLAGRGVGPETAARILGRQHADETKLLKDILAAEVQFAKTRRFWD